MSDGSTNDLVSEMAYIMCYQMLNTHALYHVSLKNNAMDKYSVETKMIWTTVNPYGTNKR